MPTISVKRDLLFDHLGKVYSDDEFRRLCFAYGLELDEVTTERQMISKEQGDISAVKDASEEIIYRIDVPANRFDLLCLEGLVKGLLIFQGKIAAPRFRHVDPLGGKDFVQVLKISPDTAQIRPFAVAAVLRNIIFTQNSLNSFIDLQDKLHHNICRKRSLVAIGTHDLDTIQGPFTYTAKPPTDIRFQPLNQVKKMDAVELMELYSVHPQLKQYLPIIRDSPVYPVIYDSRGIVLSLPPIINGNHSKITLNTKNIFIECTATDLSKAKIVLDTIVCMFSSYCANKFTVESCNVISPNGEIATYPEILYRTETIQTVKANAYIGIDEMPERITEMLNKMCLNTKQNGNTLLVEIPPTRHDVIHLCDIYEDIAIAYGYNKIKKKLPSFMNIAKQFPLNKLTEQLRYEVAETGFTEVLTFTLCSKDDISTKFNRILEKVPAVHISNPKTMEFQVVRTTLLPGLLKTLSANKKMPLPLKLFEVTDIVTVDQQIEVGARNERRICAVNCNKSAGFEIIHGLLDRIMKVLEIPWKTPEGYYLEATEDLAYFPGRCAKVMYKNVQLGTMGVLHPNVLQAFDIAHPCSAVELYIELFV